MGTFHEYHGQRPTGMGVAGSHLASSSQRRHPFTGSTTSNDKAADATDDGRKSRWQRTSGTRSILRSREYLVRYANQGVTEVLPGLFLGDWNSSFPRSLQEHGITAIVSVCSEPSLGWEAPGTAIPELGIKVESTRSLVCRCHHLWLRVEDCENFNIYKYFQAACIFIDQHWSHAARPEFKNKVRGSDVPELRPTLPCMRHPQPMRGNVLVHGAMGVSRSVMMMCAYIMVKYDKPLATVLQHIRKQGRMVDPNEGFCRQLDRWFENGFAYTEKEAKEYGYWFGGSRTAAGDPQDELERQDEKDLKGKAKNVVQEDDQVIGEVFRPANITLAAAFRERSAAPGLASSPVYDSRIACTSSQQPTGSLRTTGSTCTVTSPKFHPKPAVRRTVAELIDIDCDYGHVWERHLARELKEYEIQSQKRRERERQETVRRRREQQARERFEGFWNSGGWDSEDERKHEVWRRAMEEHFPAEERREAEEKAATAVVMDRDAERVIIREDGRKLAAPARKKLRNVVPRTDGRNVAGPFRARLIPPREETVKVTPARIMSVQTTEAWETVSEDTRPMEPLECTENSIDGDFAGTRAVEAQDVERRVHREVERMLDEIVELTATTLETSNDAKITDVDVPPASLQEEEGTFASFPRQSEKAGQRTTSTDGPASRRPNGKVAAYFTGKSNKDTTNSPTPRETKCVESSMPEDPGSLQRAHALRRKRLTSGQLRAVSFTASASMIAVAQQGDGVGPELSAVINEPPAKATSTSKSDDSGSRGAAERITSLSRSPTSANCGMGMRGVVAYMR